MNRWLRIILSLLITTGVWLAFSWPLPNYFSSGIPWSAHHKAEDQISVMPAGDHLQTLYQFWLASDMVRGKTPAFSNVYEFNMGDDAARRQIRPYYFPFSYIYHLLEPVRGRAFAWNMTGCLLLWATFLATWILVRRYTDRESLAMVAALIAIVMPVRWIGWFGGSPIGMAMVWAPLLFLGIDMAVREARIFGGVIAGLALLFASWTDTHMFFFGALSAPVWVLVAWIQREAHGRTWSSMFRLAVALLPVAVLAGAAFILNKVFMSSASASVLAGGGRMVNEILIFSPKPSGLFSFQGGPSDQIYLGWATLFLALLAMIVFALKSGTIPQKQLAVWNGRKWAFWILAAGLLAMIILALGPRGPKDGWIFEKVRALIPPYSMIRQPPKIFCLLPTWLAVLAVLSWNNVAQLVQGRALKVMVLVWTAVMVMEYKQVIRPAICLLDKEQTAYRVVAADAVARKVQPRVVVLPLWTGDSHWASLYEYYASLYRIRMLNGYHPVVKRDYKDAIFSRLESVNKGYLTDEQIQLLQEMGIEYVLFHENAFPEKVSPFPSGCTLKRLLEHPRLEWMTQADGVWAFRIVAAENRSSQEVSVAAPIFFPARTWEAESLVSNRMAVAIIEGASGDKAAALMAGEAVRFPPVRLPADGGLRWLARVRGDGVLRVQIYENDNAGAVNEMEIKNPDWAWVDVPIAMQLPYAALMGEFMVASGRLALDSIILTGGSWKMLLPGESMEMPATAFFHAGYTDPQSGRVVLRHQRDPADVVFYGWRLPAAAGEYEVEVLFQTWASEGVKVGEVVCGNKSEGDAVLAELKPGARAVGRFTRANNMPFQLGVRYTGADTLEISAVRLTRLPDAEKIK